MEMDEMYEPFLVMNEFFQDDSIEIAAILALQQKAGMESAPASRKGRAPNLKRDFASAHEQIVADYFTDNPVYGPEMFERRFRMSQAMFLKICAEIQDFDNCFRL